MNYSTNKIPRSLMEALFRYSDANNVLDSAYNNVFNRNLDIRHTHSFPNKDMLIRAILNRHTGYSESEIHERVISGLQSISNCFEGYKEVSSIFNLVVKQAIQYLNNYENSFTVKFDELLRWRELTFKIGIDLFTCAYAAYYDINTAQSNERKNFNWPIVLVTDSPPLQTLLNRKLAETHAHFVATGPVVQPAWVSLMNKVTERSAEFKKAGLDTKYLDPSISSFPAIKEFELQKQVILAAKIRTILHTITNALPHNQDDLLKALHDRDIIYTDINYIQTNIDTLKYDAQSFNGHIIDYAITKELHCDSNDISILYCGERKLMYRMLKGIIKRDSKIFPFADAFYAYLLIKARFRAELVQVNNLPGFRNFMAYENRKDIFVDNDNILKHSRLHLAIHGAFKKQNLQSYDLRVKPKSSKREMRKHLSTVHKTVRFNILNPTFNLALTGVSPVQQNLTNFEQSKIVFHFIKREDRVKDLPFWIDSVFSRQFQLRNEVRRQSWSIVQLRDSNNYYSKAIKAIDAANNEIGCRPEVFAQAFRFVRNHQPKPSFLKSLTETLKPITCKHHCGEEFLDIVDGLRYIDESIAFMELRRGDHLGHVLALGLSAADWYTVKHHSIALPAHDYLDNIVWLLGTANRFSINLENRLLNHLESEFNLLSIDIYGDTNNTWLDFYQAWRLRGDAPELYKTGEYQKPAQFRYWSRCAIMNDETLLRYNKKISNLYYKYHYDATVRKKGNIKVIKKIYQPLIKAVDAIQCSMRNDIEKRQLYIETLPSCNVTISTFKRYEKHPILTFFDPSAKSTDKTVLHVSINTDNPGVFDTSLENEFALMAAALTKAKDENGNPKYTQNEIFLWLERVRQMGIEQIID